MQQARYYHGCFPVYTNNIITEIVVVGGYCRDYSNTIPNCDKNKMNSTEILSLADMTWSHGPDFPFELYNNKGVTGLEDEGYLGYSIGGYGTRTGWGSQNEIMGLQKSNGRFQWVTAGSMSEPRYSHTAIKTPRSLTPSCR